MTQLMEKKVLVLLSGGPDSKTLVKFAEKEGAELVGALYLQSGHETDDQEIAAAQKIAKEHGLPLEVIDVSDVVKKLGGDRIVMHAGTTLMEFGFPIMLSISTAHGIRIGADLLLIGLHADDVRENHHYGQAFLDQFQALASTTSPNTPVILAPFLSLTKQQVIALGIHLGVDYAATWSCTTSGNIHCGLCGACKARAQAFAAAGAFDPTAYVVLPVQRELRSVSRF